MQVSGSMGTMRARALVQVRAARSLATQRAPGLDLIALVKCNLMEAHCYTEYKLS